MLRQFQKFLILVFKDNIFASRVDCKRRIRIFAIPNGQLFHNQLQKKFDDPIMDREFLPLPDLDHRLRWNRFCAAF